MRSFQKNVGKYSLFYTGRTKIAAEKPKIESLKTDVMGKCLFPIFLEVPKCNLFWKDLLI